MNDDHGFDLKGAVAGVMLALIFVIIMAAQGCGTIRARSPNADETLRFYPPYAGMKYDMHMISQTPGPLQLLIWGDLPLSFALDTAGLLADVPMWWARQDLKPVEYRQPEPVIPYPAGPFQGIK